MEVILMPDYNVTNCRLNATNSSGPEATDGSTNTLLIGIFSSVLSFIIVIGNGLIIVSVALVKKLRQPANYLIVSLALSDFLVGLVVLPLTIIYDAAGEWVFGAMVCDVHVSFDVICCTASIMNLCMISIDRYLMITKPMTYPKQRTGKLMLILISAAWILSALVILPALFGFTKNVKDEPTWLSLNQSFVPSEYGSNRTGINASSSAWTLLDDDPNNFWTPGKDTRYWHFVFDLKQTFRITKFSVQNVDAQHDVLQYQIQECQDSGSWKNVETIQLDDNTTSVQEETLSSALELQVFRMNVSETYNGSRPRLRNFSVFGEKVHGKTCLISQEVWFALYSTVGAFYLPLSIMLCMYWKIFVEASKFHLRNQIRAATVGGSQEWNATPPGTPDRYTMRKVRGRILMKYKKRNGTNNNNNNLSRTEGFTLIRNNVSESSDDRPSTLGNGVQHKKHPTVIIVDEDDSNDRDNRENVFDDDTISSECDFMTNDRFDRSVKLDTLTDEDGSRTDLETLTPNSCDKNSFSCLHGTNTRTLETLVNGFANLSAPQRPRSRTRSATSADGVSQQPNGRLVSPLTLSDRAESAGSGLDAPGWRLAKTSETSSSSLDVGKKSSSQENCASNGYGDSRSNLIVHSHQTRSRTSYTRSVERKTPAQNNRLPRCSIFSGASMRSPPQSRLGSVQTKCSSRGTLSTPSLPRGNNALYKRTQLNGDAPTPACRRRSTVFDQIRRRVSLAPSRERMRNVKATRTLGIVVGAFTFCWLPFFIVTFIRPFICEEPESQDCIPLWLVRLVLWLGYVNSALNPLIYIGFSPDLRQTFRYLICCKCTNVDRRLAQSDIRRAYSMERRASSMAKSAAESIL